MEVDELSEESDKTTFYFPQIYLPTAVDVKVNEASAGGDLKETNDDQDVIYSATSPSVHADAVTDSEESTIDSQGSTYLNVDESFENIL